MSDLIRMYGMKMSHNGICRHCGEPRDKGNHSRCCRWPSGMSKRNHAGFHYVANSVESDIAEFKKITELIAAGESGDTPVQFEIRIRQVKAKPPNPSQPPTTTEEPCQSSTATSNPTR